MVTIGLYLKKEADGLMEIMNDEYHGVQVHRFADIFPEAPVMVDCDGVEMHGVVFVNDHLRFDSCVLAEMLTMLECSGVRHRVYEL